MKSLNSLSIHAIEKNAMERVAGGTPGVKAGSFGSWSWSAGDYTDDYENGRYTRDFSGSVSYDGKALNGVLDPRELSPDVPEEFIGGAYYFE